jgi:hypothetical protein
MTVIQPAMARLDPATAAPLMANLGFMASSDLPDGPGPAYLVLALRDHPTLRHYDPEAVEYWVSEAGCGVRRTLTRGTRMPIETDFSWGLIRIVDRLHVTNEYLTFGGRLSADVVDGVVIVVFNSPAPLLRRGGHSQAWDEGAESLGAFYGRFLVAVDYAPGFEARAAKADPVTRYAAFVADTMARYRASPLLRDSHGYLWTLLRAEEQRLQHQHPTRWAAGDRLRRDAAGLWGADGSARLDGASARA